MRYFTLLCAALLLVALGCDRQPGDASYESAEGGYSEADTDPYGETTDVYGIDRREMAEEPKTDAAADAGADTEPDAAVKDDEMKPSADAPAAADEAAETQDVAADDAVKAAEGDVDLPKALEPLARDLIAAVATNDREAGHKLFLSQEQFDELIVATDDLDYAAHLKDLDAALSRLNEEVGDTAAFKAIDLGDDPQITTVEKGGALDAFTFKSEVEAIRNVHIILTRAENDEYQIVVPLALKVDGEWKAASIGTQ